MDKCRFISIATAATSMTIAIAVFTHLFNFAYFRIIPSATASKINSTEVVATDPFAATLVTAPDASAEKPLNVPATTSANAAITKIQNSQQKIENNFFPNFPIYSSIIYPIVRPLFFTEAYIAAKSCTAPTKTPPIRIHKNAGSHPKTHFVILLFVILLKIRIFSRNSEKHKSHIIIFRLVLVLSFTPQKVLTLTK